MTNSKINEEAANSGIAVEFSDNDFNAIQVHIFCFYLYFLITIYYIYTFLLLEIFNVFFNSCLTL